MIVLNSIWSKLLIPLKGSYHSNELLIFEDELFVRNAFYAIMRKIPENNDIDQILDDLRSEKKSKIDILWEMKYSDVGRQYEIPILNLKRKRLFQKISSKLHKLIPFFSNGINSRFDASVRLNSRISYQLLGNLVESISQKDQLTDISIQTLKDNLSDMKNEFEKIKDELTQKTDSVVRRILTVEENLRDLNSRMPVVEENLRDLNSRMPVVEENLRDLNSRMPVVEENLRDLNSRMPVVEENLRDLNSRMPVVEENLRDLNSRMPVVEENLRDLNSRMPVVEENLRDLNSRMPVTEENLRNLNEQIPIIFKSQQALEEQKEVVDLELSNLSTFREIALTKFKKWHEDWDYQSWIKHSLSDLKKVNPTPPSDPLTMVVFIHNPNVEFFMKTIHSLENLEDAKLGIFLFDFNPNNTWVRNILFKTQKNDARFRIFLFENFNMESAAEIVLNEAGTNHIFFLSQEARIDNDSYHFLRSVPLVEDLDLIYSDDDILENNIRTDPYFKPDFSPYYLRAFNYIGSSFILKKEHFKPLGKKNIKSIDEWQYPVLLDLAGRSGISTVHVKQVAVHYRIRQAISFTRHKEILLNSMNGKDVKLNVREGIFPGSVNYNFSANNKPKISLIIPNKNQPQLLKAMVESVRNKTKYGHYELIIMDNESGDPQLLDYYKELEKDKRIKILYWDKPFNYSAIMNAAVHESSGEILCFLNNDMEIIQEDWLDILAGFAAREDVGIVSPKLLYSDNTIQHAGVVGYYWHAFRGLERSGQGYMGRAATIQNYSIVTGACMMLRKSVFLEAGGFDERYAVGFSDFDLCLKILTMKLNVVWVPDVEIYHYECATRGYDDSKETMERYFVEVAYYRGRWGKLIESGDPYYHSALDAEKADYRIKGN